MFDALFAELPSTIKWIHEILTAEADCKPRLVVHCTDEIRGHIVACAYRECRLLPECSILTPSDDSSDVL